MHKLGCLCRAQRLSLALTMSKKRDWQSIVLGEHEVHQRLGTTSVTGRQNDNESQPSKLRSI